MGNVPLPPLEFIVMLQVYVPGNKPAVLTFTVIVSFSPVESPVVGETDIQPQSSEIE